MCRTCEEYGAHKGHAKELLISKVAELRTQLECRIKQTKLNIQRCTELKNELDEYVSSLMNT